MPIASRCILPVAKDWKPLDKIYPDMARAAIAGEDSRFCSHNGFDFKAMAGAAYRNTKGGRIRGGSTISQQTAKNVFLIQGGGYVRKWALADRPLLLAVADGFQAGRAPNRHANDREWWKAAGPPLYL